MVLLFTYFSRYIFCMSFRPRFYGGFFCSFTRVRPRTRVCTRDNYIYRQNNYTIPVKKSTAILSRFLFFPQEELLFADSFRENIRKPTWKRRIFETTTAKSYFSKTERRKLSTKIHDLCERTRSDAQSAHKTQRFSSYFLRITRRFLWTKIFRLSAFAPAAVTKCRPKNLIIAPIAEIGYAIYAQNKTAGCAAAVFLRLRDWVKRYPLRFYAVFAHIAQGIFQKRFTGNTCVFPEPKNKRRKTVVFRLFL